LPLTAAPGRRLGKAPPFALQEAGSGQGARPCLLPSCGAYSGRNHTQGSRGRFVFHPNSRDAGVSDVCLARASLLPAVRWALTTQGQLLFLWVTAPPCESHFLELKNRIHQAWVFRLKWQN